MKLEYLDSVVLTQNLPAAQLHKGALGTIVEVLAEDVFLVEFADTNGETVAMLELAANQLMKVFYEPLRIAA